MPYKAYRLVKDDLVVEDRERPRLQRSEVRVRLRAASLNFRDLMLMRGAFSDAALENVTPLSDGAGEVIETGDDVWRVKRGDRVAITFFADWIAGEWQPMPDTLGRGGGIEGVAQQEMVLRQEELVGIPDHLDFVEASTLPCAAVTAWSALMQGPRLMPGDAVLTHGSGGVSVFTIQLGRALGARVFATTTSPGKVDALRAVGAEDVFLSTNPGWPDALLHGLQGYDNPGVDRVVETIGGDSFAVSLHACRQGAHVSLVGLQRGSPEGSELQFYKGVSTSVIRVGSRADFMAMNRVIAATKMRPLIDRRFPFEQLTDALTYLGSQQHVGKVVLELG